MYMVYTADGISGSASVRLLRLVRQACACSAEPATAVQLLLHVQYSESALLYQCTQGMCSLEL